MTPITTIDQQIQRLQTKKKSLTQKVAITLLERLQTTLGSDFSPDLVLCLVGKTWTTATSETKEGWITQAATFQTPKTRQKSHKLTTHPTTDNETPAVSV